MLGNLYTDGNCGFVGSITVASPQARLTINSGNVGEISVIQSKDIFINGGNIVKLTAMAGNFSSNTVGKIHISGTPTFENTNSPNAQIIIPTAYDGSGTVTRGSTIVLNNGKTGSERVPYTGNPIKVALDYKTGNSAPLFGQVVAEDVTQSQKGLIELVSIGSGKLSYRLVFGNGKLIVAQLPDLFDDGVKFYRNNLWDTFRSPAYPSSNRPFHLYDLSAPFDAKMNRIDFSGEKYVKFQQNKTHTTVADLPTADKNRIINSLKYSTYSNEEAILNALIVSEVLYNGDGTVNRVLANVGLIWSLGEQGFLYTSLDGDGAFPYSGGIGTYVTFKAHNDGDSIVDETPKNDPLSKDDFDPDGDGNGTVEIPTLPDTVPPVNNDIYINYLGKVIDNNGNPLVGVSVGFAYNQIIFNVVTDGSGYFIVPNFLVTAGQETATVYLLYYDDKTQYGEKIYSGMPIATYDAVTYIYPLTSSTDDGTVQQPPHTLTAIACVPPTCSAEGSFAHYICKDTSCNCGKIYSDEQGQREITATEIVIAKIPHMAQEIPAVAATCTQTGLTAGSICSVCNEVLTAQTIIDKIPHTAVEIPAVSATCTQTGLTAGSMCSVCEEILTAQIITDKIPHTVQEIPAVGATCTQTGLTEGSKCSVCNEILTAQTVTDKIPHTAVEIPAVSATCTQTGLTAGSICSVCDTIITAQTVLPILEHQFNNGEVTTQPTTDAEGEKTYTCSVCGHTKVESIPKLTGVEKDDISLLWLIILLAIINVLELIAIVFLLAKRRGKNNEKHTELNCCVALPLLLSSGQAVSGHLSIVIVLGVAAVLQAVFILVLALRRRKEKPLNVEIKSTEKIEDSDEKATIEEQ